MVGALKTGWTSFSSSLLASSSPPKCHSQAGVEETRLRRASSSPSWLSVRLFLCVSPFFSLTFYPGASGTGRTTFVNTLCESEVLAHKVADNPDTAHIEEGIRIKPVNVGTTVSRSPSSLPSNPLSQNSKRMAFVLPSPSLTRLVLATTLTMSSR